MRPLNENGTWQHKTEKEYLCVKDGEERGFTAAEFKEAQKDGWEKQYLYKVGKKKEYMAPSVAEAQGLERTSKHPKSTKYGRDSVSLNKSQHQKALHDDLAVQRFCPFCVQILVFLLRRCSPQEFLDRLFGQLGK